MRTTTRFLKSVFPVLTVLLLFMCTDANIVSPDRSESLVDRIAESPEFKATLVGHKRFIKPFALQTFYVTTKEEAISLQQSRKAMIDKGESATEDEVLSFFNYRHKDVFKRNIITYAKAVEAFFEKFPELKNLSDTNLRFVLLQSIKTFKANYWKEHHKKDGPINGKTCSGDHSDCLADSELNYNIANLVCMSITLGIIGGSIVVGNPFLVMAAAGFGMTCVSYAAYAYTESFGRCASNMQACYVVNPGGSYNGYGNYYYIPNPRQFVQHDLNYYYAVEYWPEIPFYEITDPNGCFYDINGNQVCY